MVNVCNVTIYSCTEVSISFPYPVVNNVVFLDNEINAWKQPVGIRHSSEAALRLWSTDIPERGYKEGNHAAQVCNRLQCYECEHCCSEWLSADRNRDSGRPPRWDSRSRLGTAEGYVSDSCAMKGRGWKRHGREIFYLNWMEMTCWDGGLSFFYLFIFLLEHSVSRIMSRLFGLPNDSLIHFFFSALKRQIFCPVRTSFSNKLSCESYISALYRNISMAEEHCGTQGV